MMVRRRKQLKPSGTQENRPESGLTISDPTSPLVTLPAEIQGIITSNLVQFRDLNHLCCTCKTLCAVVLPTLYHTIELKVPLHWSRLPSLENLLSSSSEGLKYVKSLRIVTKQHRRGDETENANESGDEEVDTDESEGEAEGDEDAGVFKIYHPHSSASNALNAFIRVLIVKLPPQQLHTFWWQHACPINTLTLLTVLKHQKASIHTLKLGQCSGTWRQADSVTFTIEGLRTLDTAELGRGWPRATELLAKNYQNLRHLRLGSELDLVSKYARSGCVPHDEIGRFRQTEVFKLFMKDSVTAFGEASTPVTRLESLSLIALDVEAFAQGLIEPVIDFKNLSKLTLESCIGLEAAFPLLLGKGAGRRKAKSALRLHTLVLRHEHTTDEFSRELKSFLVLLKPLAHLHVLLEGAYFPLTIEMREVLQVHGNCLQSLVWDERSGPRIGVRIDNAQLPDDLENLELVAKHCPGLKALGISLAWEDIIEFEASHKKITSSFSRLGQLQTLNIRNLPESRKSKTWLPNDYMMDGLATMLLNIIAKKTRIEQAPVLKTLAIGASTYGNVMMGMTHYTPNTTSTYLQLRIYHVSYDCRYRNSLSPKLHLIARGTPADARGDAENLDIFTPYWLDGVPRG